MNQQSKTLEKCPKCGGNLIPDDDELSCLQCGYRQTLKILPYVNENAMSRSHGISLGNRPEWDKRKHLNTPQIGSVLKLTEKESRWKLQRKVNTVPRLKPEAHHLTKGV